MPETKLKNSLGSTEIVDIYFLEHRAKLIDIAAFLDRLSRASDSSGAEDFRMKAFKKGVAVLMDNDSDKARRALEVFSDYTKDLPESAPGSKGAFGAAREDAK